MKALLAALAKLFGPKPASRPDQPDAARRVLLPFERLSVECFRSDKKLPRVHEFALTRSGHWRWYFGSPN